MTQDPVCGMTVDEATAEFKSEYEGEAYYFCSEACKQMFDENPDVYTEGGGFAATKQLGLTMII